MTGRKCLLFIERHKKFHDSKGICRIHFLEKKIFNEIVLFAFKDESEIATELISHFGKLFLQIPLKGKRGGLDTKDMRN